MSRFIDAEPRYVDADSLKRKWLFRGKDGKPYRDEIDAMPTADVVKVTRCKDCMHTEIDKYAPAECQNRCKLSQLYHEPTFFCKCGEPRTDLLEWLHRGDDDE